jgi:hypothetical protein
MFLLSPDSACGTFTMEWPWTMTFTPSYCFVLFLLFISIYCIDFYLLVLCYSPLISASHFIAVLFSTTASWCFPSLHMVYLPQVALGYNFPLLLFCFGLSTYKPNITLSFPIFLPLCSNESSPVSHYHTC